MIPALHALTEVLAVVGLVSGLGSLAWHLRLEFRRRRRELRATPLPGPQIDVRQVQPAVSRVCVACLRPFQSHPAMVALTCDDCAAKAFEAEERDNPAGPADWPREAS